jgi:hypothetical protein
VIESSLERKLITFAEGEGKRGLDRDWTVFGGWTGIWFEPKTRFVVWLFIITDATVFVDPDVAFVSLLLLFV